MGLFDFIQDAENYDDRKVDRYESGDLIVDTAGVSDGEQPYETAVAHPRYNSGKWVIVEAYSTKVEAQTGHERWVRVMTDPQLPTVLTDCLNSEISRLISVTGGTQDFEKGAKR